MTFRFSTEGTDFDFRCQQAIRLALPGVDDPWGAVRTFSLSSSPTERGFLSVTCKITDTPFKQALAALQPGAPAQAYGPIGAFLLDESRPAVFLAGGIGISPFRGMLTYARDRSLPGPFRLLYSARTPEELVFRGELEALKGQLPDLRVEYAITRPADSREPWPGRVQRIDAAWIRDSLAGLDRPMFYVVGLPEMAASTIGLLQRELGISEADIDYEVFRGF